MDPDDLQVLDIIDGRSSFGGYRDPPKLKPKPRRLIAKRKTSVERSLGPSDAISSPTEQNQWRDSSVE
jgi:hypothetical protein